MEGRWVVHRDVARVNSLNGKRHRANKEVHLQGIGLGLLVVLSVHNDAVERPVWNVAGGLCHVGHRVVGEHAKRCDRDEVIIEVILQRLIIVIDIEFQVVAW